MSARNVYPKALFVIVIINLIVISLNLIILKKRSVSQKETSLITQSVESAKLMPLEIVNFRCPEIVLNSIDGRKIALTSLLGNVIIIKFSRFYKSELLILIYLEHLSEKYKDQGISLILVNSLGKHDADVIGNYCSLRSPIIEDNCNLAAIFNARPEDAIIIDRDFVIKYICRTNLKSQIYSATIDCIGRKRIMAASIEETGLSKIFQNICFYDILGKSRRVIGELRNKSVCLTLFTSICLACEDNMRIYQLKELSKIVDLREVSLVVLFGKGNNPRAIERFAITNEWDEYPFTIGVIENVSGPSEKEYYNLFQLDLDPRTLIFDRFGKLLFSETQKSSKRLSARILKKVLS